MNKSILELLTKVTLYDLILSLLLIIAIVGILMSQKDKISKWMNKWRKSKNDEEDFRSLVYELRDSIKILSDKVDKNQKDRDNELLAYRNDSRKIREEMYKVMNHQSEQIKNLTNTVNRMEEKNSKTKRAELKEKIERIYKECSPTKTCTDMALETLKDLIEEYEEHGGINSFVHTKVEPEMYEWQVIEIIGKTKEE